MKKIISLGFPLLFIMSLLLSLQFQSCKPDDDDDDDGCDTGIVAYKPNIYIYPIENIQLDVELSFPMGGEIIASIPEYGTGWKVSVDQNGLIDNTYPFLFYESSQPDVWQDTYGWTIKTGDLEAFFRTNMVDYGFKGREIDDFIDYWIPRLDDYTYYSIYPQTKSIIDGVIQLDLSKQPDHLLRLFYVIKGHKQLQNVLIEPIITDFKREGYYVTEWGVVLK